LLFAASASVELGLFPPSQRIDVVVFELAVVERYLLGLIPRERGDIVDLEEGRLGAGGA
jgi:hypothetical protein